MFYIIHRQTPLSDLVCIILLQIWVGGIIKLITTRTISEIKFSAPTSFNSDEILLLQKLTHIRKEGGF